MTHKTPEEMPPDVARILEKFRRDDIELDGREGYSRFSILQLQQMEFVQPYCPPENWVVNNIIRTNEREAYDNAALITSIALLALKEDEEYPIPDSLYHIKHRATIEGWFKRDNEMPMHCHFLDLIIIIDNAFREIMRVNPRYCDIRIISQMVCQELWDNSQIGDHLLYGDGTESGAELTKLYDWMGNIIVCPHTLYTEIIRYMEEHLMGQEMPEHIREVVNTHVSKQFAQEVELDPNTMQEFNWNDNWGFNQQSKRSNPSPLGLLGLGWGIGPTEI
jgi:hypothetical protein